MQIQDDVPHDRHSRLQYCEQLVWEHERDPRFIEHILWTVVFIVKVSLTVTKPLMGMGQPTCYM
jgi:hypothetical protein